MTTSFSALNGAVLVPLIILIGTAVSILIMDTASKGQRLTTWIALTGFVVAPILMLLVLASGQGGVAQGMLVGNGFSALWAMFFCSVGAAAILLGLDNARNNRSLDGGYYALVLFAATGGLIVAQSTHLLPLVTGLTILYLSLAALSGKKAAWRHLIVYSSGLAFVLLGTSLLYGTTGTFSIELMAVRASYPLIERTINPLYELGLWLIGCGIVFPLTVLFFDLTPPYTQPGLSRPALYLLCTMLPGVAVVILNRLISLWSLQHLNLLTLLGALSACLGYGLAARSCQVENALCKIAVAQTGLLLLGLATFSTAGWTSQFYLLVGHGLSLTSLWALSVYMSQRKEPLLQLDALVGMGRNHPGTAMAITLCMLNVTGMPPLAGAMGQFFTLQSSVNASQAWIVGPLLVANSLAWLWAGRWIKAIWGRDKEAQIQGNIPPEVGLIVFSAAVGVWLMGLRAETTQGWIARILAIP